MLTPTHNLSYSARADLPSNSSLGIYLLHLIAIKNSNLCVSADVNSTSALFRLAEEVGDSICVLKTHADIIDDFGERTIKGLKEISKRKKFLIFEDRKFGDIGSTVQAQYTRGPLAIATWAHLTNAHIFPGPAIITALHSAAKSTIEAINKCVLTEISAGTPRPSSDYDEDDDEQPQDGDSDYSFTKPSEIRPMSSSGRKGSVVTAITTISQTVETHDRTPSTLSRTASAGEDEIADREAALEELGDPPLARGLLLLAEMSSEGNLMTGPYTQRCIQAARANPDFVLGFISQRSLNERRGDNFLSFTPGVSLPPEGEGYGSAKVADGLGQQYRTPAKVVREEGCDVVIVGRGILRAGDRKREAERYRREAWGAYERRIGKGGKR